MPRKIFVVGCSSSKKSEPACANEFYTGPLTKLGLELASRYADETYILSAKYGIIPLGTELKPYDTTINAFDNRPFIQLIKNTIPFKENEITFIGGGSYASCLFAAGLQVSTVSNWFRETGSRQLYSCYKNIPLPRLQALERDYLESRSALIFDSKNGVPTPRIKQRPRTGSKTGRIWDVVEVTLDRSQNEVRGVLYAEGFHDHTIRIQYKKFHEFYGLPLMTKRRSDIINLITGG